MASVEVLYNKNDMLFKVEGLKDERNDSFADDSWTVEVTLKDSEDNDVEGQSWPLTLSYESSTDGNFTGTIEDAVDVSVGDLLTAELDVTSDLGFDAYWEIPVQVVTRDG